jgi:hypothetical protein
MGDSFRLPLRYLCFTFGIIYLGLLGAAVYPFIQS